MQVAIMVLTKHSAMGNLKTQHWARVVRVFFFKSPLIWRAGARKIKYKN